MINYCNCNLPYAPINCLTHPRTPFPVLQPLRQWPAPSDFCRTQAHGHALIGCGKTRVATRPRMDQSGARSDWKRARSAYCACSGCHLEGTSAICKCRVWVYFAENLFCQISFRRKIILPNLITFIFVRHSEVSAKIRIR